MAKSSLKASLHFRRANVNGVSCLVPTDDDTGAWLQKRKIGAVVAMSADQVRNAERNALFWVLCQIVTENSADVESKEQAACIIQILTGCTHVGSYMEGGKRRFVQWPKSLAFANMDEAEFEAFFNRALDAIEQVLLPGVDIDDLRRESYLRAGA